MCPKPFLLGLTVNGFSTVKVEYETFLPPSTVSNFVFEVILLN